MQAREPTVLSVQPPVVRGPTIERKKADTSQDEETMADEDREMS